MSRHGASRAWSLRLATGLAVIPLIVAMTAPAQAGEKPAAHAPAADAAFGVLADRFIDEVFLPENPSTATQLGAHRWDGRLEDYSRAGLARQGSTLRSWQHEFSNVDAGALSEQAAQDRELLLASIRSELLTLDTLRPWQKNPDMYSSGIANAAFVIMERDYAPAAERLASLIAREQAMPAALQEAHRNLRNPPQILTRIAIEQLPGTIGLFENDLPAAFAGVSDASLLARFRQTNAAVIAALRDYQQWLTSEVLPHARGDFRIGARAFRDKLRYDEMVDTPLDRLLEIGTADLQRNQHDFARVALEIDPQRSVADVLAELDASHPPAGELLESFRRTFDSLIEFIGTHHIITLPPGDPPLLQETPPFMRATTTASMDSPGLLEPRHDLRSFFNVTLPDPSWDARRVEDYLHEFSFSDIAVTAVHEAYPGHYVQALWQERGTDRTRKVFNAASNFEGWAHYCEQMMLDEGFGEPGPGASPQALRAARMLRLAQIKEALLRDARFVVGIRMHTGSMSFEEAIEFFERQGYQSHEIAEIEARRGTTDPTYLYYTLGKLQIQKLRADVAAREGAGFSLQRFHDEFMRQGAVPIRLVRRAMLHDDSPVL